MEQQNGLRPFDLEAAKRGEPLVTRDGRDARFNGIYGTPTTSFWAEVNGGMWRFYPNGRFLHRGDHPLDLFMAPIEKPKDDIPQGCRPFDLEAAKRGEPLVTRGGRNARFISHLEDVAARVSVVVLIDGESVARLVPSDGSVEGLGVISRHVNDLFMAPKPKRKLWVNVYIHHCDQILTSAAFESEENAAAHATKLQSIARAIAQAIPIEVEDWEAGK